MLGLRGDLPRAGLRGGLGLGDLRRIRLCGRRRGVGLRAFLRRIRIGGGRAVVKLGSRRRHPGIGHLRGTRFLGGLDVAERLVAHDRRQRPLQHVELHGLREILARIEDRGRIAGMPQRRRHRIPAEAVQMHAHAGVRRLRHARQHVGVAGHQDHVGGLAPHAGDHHVGDQARIHRLLRAAITPFDELPRTQLHAVDGAQGTLITVRPRLRDAVVPELPLHRLPQLLRDHAVENMHHLSEIDFQLPAGAGLPRVVKAREQVRRVDVHQCAFKHGLLQSVHC